jgi:hypothetical protein
MYAEPHDGLKVCIRYQPSIFILLIGTRLFSSSPPPPARLFKKQRRPLKGCIMALLKLLERWQSVAAGSSHFKHFLRMELLCNGCSISCYFCSYPRVFVVSKFPYNHLNFFVCKIRGNWGLLCSMLLFCWNKLFHCYVDNWVLIPAMCMPDQDVRNVSWHV